MPLRPASRSRIGGPRCSGSRRCCPHVRDRPDRSARSRESAHPIRARSSSGSRMSTTIRAGVRDASPAIRPVRARCPACRRSRSAGVSRSGRRARPSREPATRRRGRNGVLERVTWLTRLSATVCVCSGQRGTDHLPGTIAMAARHLAGRVQDRGLLGWEAFGQRSSWVLATSFAPRR